MSVCLACNVQATDLFKTSQDIALRAPSVPLITSDTYLAIWSPYNELNEGNTEHWTNPPPPLPRAPPETTGKYIVSWARTS